MYRESTQRKPSVLQYRELSPVFDIYREIFCHSKDINFVPLNDIGVRRSYWMMVSPVVKNNLKCDADFSLEVNRMYDIMDLIVPILIIVAIAVIILAFFKSMKEINK